MRFLFGFSFLLLTATVCSAQDKPFSNDERGKLIYYEVVSLKGAAKDSLTARATRFIEKSARTLKIKSAIGDTLIYASGKMVLNKTALVLSRPSGEVLYNFYAETRDDKYRFWLTDFNFIPYQRDRYGNFVPSTTVGMPLETKPGKLNAAEWTTYIKAATKEANVLAGRFKEAMAGKVPAQPVKVEPVRPTQKW